MSRLRCHKPIGMVRKWKCVHSNANVRFVVVSDGLNIRPRRGAVGEKKKTQGSRKCGDGKKKDRRHGRKHGEIKFPTPICGLHALRTRSQCVDERVDASGRSSDRSRRRHSPVGAQQVDERVHDNGRIHGTADLVATASPSTTTTHTQCRNTAEERRESE